ncbi:MAG: VOC family protein [bacterium]
MNLNLAINHAHFRCGDVEAAAEFYQRVLGAEWVKRTEFGGRVIVTLRLGGTLFCLSPAAAEAAHTAEENSRRLGVYHLAFNVPNLEEAVAECKQRGAKFVIEHLQASPTRRVAFMEAPDGMQMELMEDAEGLVGVGS